MRVHIPNFDQNKIGGGWTATRYLSEGLGNHAYEESDIFLITGPTMVSHGEVEKAKADGKKIVLRADNHLLPSRNRNTGMSRLKAFAEAADLVIYQSQWAREYLCPFTGRDGVVILNGVDTNLYSPKDGDGCLYVRSSRINEKGWDMARYWYSRNQDHGHLRIVGKFSHENLEYGFDFFNGENFTFFGEVDKSNLANLMQNSRYFLYSYFMDACSNTLIEALFSGCEIVDVHYCLTTGGAPEIMEAWQTNREILTKEYMIEKYQESLRKLV